MSKLSVPPKVLAVAAAAGLGLASLSGIMSPASADLGDPAPGAATLNVKAFMDWNGDGIQDADEGAAYGAAFAVSGGSQPSLEGYPLVYAGAGTFIFTDFGGERDGDGKPIFRDPATGELRNGLYSEWVPDTYTIAWGVMPGCQAGPIPDGMTASDGSLMAEGETILSEVATGTVTMVANEGYSYTIPVTCDPIAVSTHAFSDIDGDGVMSEGDKDVAGVEVKMDGFVDRPWLVDEALPRYKQFVGAAVANSASTDEAGAASIERMIQGNWDVTVTTPDGCTVSGDVPATQALEWGDDVTIEVPLDCGDEPPPATTTTTSTTAPPTTTTVAPTTTEPAVIPIVTTTMGQSDGGVQVNTGSGSGSSPLAVALGGLTLAGACAGAVVLYRRRLI